MRQTLLTAAVSTLVLVLGSSCDPPIATLAAEPPARYERILEDKLYGSQPLTRREESAIVRLLQDARTEKKEPAEPEEPPEDPEPVMPVAVIDGPSKAVPGEIVILDASLSERAEFFKWDVRQVSGFSEVKEDEVQRAFDVLRKEQLDGPLPNVVRQRSHVVSADGMTCQVASYPGAEYDIVLAVSNLDGIDIKHWTVTVADCPGDEPDDPDVPPPPGDDIADQVREWVELIPAEHRTLLPKFGKAVSEIGERAGELGTVEAVDAMVTFAITSQFAGPASEWGPLFTKFDAYLATVEPRGLAAYGDALESIGRALE